MDIERLPIATQEARLLLRLYDFARHEGGDPSNLLDLLAHIVKERIWERMKNDEGNKLSFRELIAAP